MLEGTVPLRMVPTAGGPSFVSKELLHGEVQYLGLMEAFWELGQAMS